MTLDELKKWRCPKCKGSAKGRGAVGDSVPVCTCRARPEKYDDNYAEPPKNLADIERDFRRRNGR